MVMDAVSFKQAPTVTIAIPVSGIEFCDPLTQSYAEALTPSVMAYGGSVLGVN